MTISGKRNPKNSSKILTHGDSAAPDSYRGRTRNAILCTAVSKVIPPPPIAIGGERGTLYNVQQFQK